jgi:glycosyltransferase
MISIVTAVFNSEDTILDCLASVHNQANCQIEHIIIDGKSTDTTLNKIITFQKDNPQSNIKYLSESDNGIYDAMNKGLRLASGEIIGILNADDFYNGNKTLSKVASVFDKTDVMSSYGDLVYINKDNIDRTVRYWHSGNFNKNKFYWGWMPPHPTFFVRRSVYNKYGLFNLSLGSAADYELMLRFLIKKGISTEYVNEVIVKMRTGGKSNVSLRNRFVANLMDRKAWRVNNLTPFPWTLYCKPLRKIPQFLLSQKKA